MFLKGVRLSKYISKPWLKATSNEINSLINNQTFLVDEPEKLEHVNQFMDVYKSKIHSDGSLGKLRLRILVRGDLQNKDLIGYT